MGTVIRSFIWSTIERFSVQGIQFVLSLIIARLVTPYDYGVVAMLTVFLSIAQIFVDSGFSNALIQKKNRTEVDYSTIFYLNLLIGFISYILLYFSSPFIASFYKIEELSFVMRFVGLNLIINAISIIPRIKLTIELDFKTQAIISLIAVIISGLIGIILAYKSFGYWALVFQTLINNSLQSILLIYYGKWYPKRYFSYSSIKELFSFGSKLLISALIDTIYQNIYTLVIGKKFSSKELGFYNRSNTFAAFPFSNLTNIITRVIYPLWCQDNINLKHSFIQTLRMSTFIIIPIAIYISCFSHCIISVVLTEAWIPMSPYMKLLSIAYIFYPITAINDNVLKVNGRSDYFMRAEIIKKILGCAILLITVKWGVLIMCYGILLYMFLGSIINMRYTKKVVNIPIIKQFMNIKDIIILNLVFAVILSLISFLPYNDLYIFIISLIIPFPLYILLSYIGRIQEYNLILKKVLK